MGEDACIAFGINLGNRSDLPERWQEQGILRTVSTQQ